MEREHGQEATISRILPAINIGGINVDDVWIEIGKLRVETDGRLKKAVMAVTRNEEED
ncbi:hypothetical protein [Nitrosospira multiformis]|uniref:Uncharacterized protein n=1 Tax=Nitrosospira multiformis (strain ATCC 25196 / NCIMB 11849 / C 71) TaxID=323848 RepID=A0A1H5VCD6_NITMU|nr:hypothetical protein [Nitrosospira multiformis]SEA54255.1 hypothetical protein SAMN05216411_1126 [Nitrosospira multiformis]SEF84979.1 hypothetical protein SAMN05216403_11178 [Nitrosospira multiformis ATCC 25196]